MNIHRRHLLGWLATAALPFTRPGTVLAANSFDPDPSSPDVRLVAADIARQQGLCARNLETHCRQLFGVWPMPEPNAARAMLITRARADFSTGRTMICRGWILSRTEAMGLWVMVEARRQDLI